MWRWILICVISSLLVACQGGQAAPALLASETPWTFADLRQIDPVDTVLPDQDIIAVYLRWSGSSQDRNRLEARLDLLELTPASSPYIIIAIDHAVGGATSSLDTSGVVFPWDTQISISTSGLIQVLDAHGVERKDLAVRQERDPTQDTLTISIRLDDILALPPSAVRLHVASLDPITNEVVDNLLPSSVNATPPPPANAFLAFWNVFPAYTPAQALRRWDAAHNGPLGSRHGFANLLRAARRHLLPLALLDLKAPASLSALDYAADLELIRALAADELLILPDYGSPSAPLFSPQLTSTLATHSRAFALQLDLPGSPFLFTSQQPGSPNRYQALIVPDTNLAGVDKGFAHRYRYAQQVLLSIPEQVDPYQANLEGLTLSAKKILLEAATTDATQSLPGERPIVVLGGDLPSSTWGDPRIALAGMDYIKHHPWIRLLAAHDLLAPPARGSLGVWPGSEASMSAPPAPHLSAEQHSAVDQEIWGAFLSATGPYWPSDQRIRTLRQHYLVYNLLLESVQDWLQNPRQIAICQANMAPLEAACCILASEKYYTMFDALSGRLLLAFYRSTGGAHLLVGPTSLVAVGTSDPDTWDLTQGLRADPAVLPGAFDDSRVSYSYQLADGRLEFWDNSLRKSFVVDDRGIHASYTASQPINVSIPLLLDPGHRFEAGWPTRYQATIGNQSIAWGDPAGLQAFIASSRKIVWSDFTATQNWMARQENPNLDPPPGHYLPFPLGLATITGSDAFTVDLAANDATPMGK